jgi:hypothetical protein
MLDEGAQAAVWINLPDGSACETTVRCAHCRAGMVPRDKRSRFCCRRCRNAWLDAHPSPARLAGRKRRVARHVERHGSYHVARRALRFAGIDPDKSEALQALRGLGHVPDWRARVGLPPVKPRGWQVARARSGTSNTSTPTDGSSSPTQPRDPWRATIGPQPPHLAPLGLSLTFADTLSTLGAAGRSLRRHLHGLVSLLVRRSHDRNLPRWALIALPRGQWGVILHDPADAQRLAGTTHAVTVGERRTSVTLGHPVRLKTPADVQPGRYRVTVEAITPVCHKVDGGTRSNTRPGVETILGALSVAIQLSGARPVGRLHIDSIDLGTQADRVEVGGHVGACHGWTGRVTVLCNAPAVYALRLAESLGLGGKTAYGLGRVRVSIERVDGRTARGQSAHAAEETG